ncbi:MAG: SpoIIE family protein phosphatase [candidate division KSB1 bacterium]|nr:SpoIIE family protein phosphatase [candidate division KSB1 bacterium]
MTCERCGKQSPNVLYCDSCGERRFKAKLRIVDQHGTDQGLYLFPQDYIIGRDPKSDILITDAAVSRRHARIGYEKGRFFIEDLGSKNGLLVNGQKQTRVWLDNFDFIQIGPATLHFYFPDSDFPEEKVHAQTGIFLQETLLKISREMQNKNLLDDILNIIADAVTSITGARELAIFLPDRKKGWVQKVTRKLRNPEPGETNFDKTQKILEYVSQKRSHFLIDASGKRFAFTALSKIIGQDYQGLALVLRSSKLKPAVNQAEQPLGVLLIRMPARNYPMDTRTALLLESLLNQATVVLENKLLYREAIEKRRIDHELELARSIQNGLLPREVVEVAHTDLAAYSMPCHYVGGDYYDLLPLPDSRLAIAVADISGKGIGAALLMSSLQGSLRAQIQYEQQPVAMVQHLNRFICSTNPGSLFATLFYALYHYNDGRLDYANAGHNPPVLLRPDGSQQLLKSSTTALGILEEAQPEERSVQLHPGDVLLLYTDGLTEAMDREMRPLGIQPMVEAARSAMQQYPDIAATEIQKAVLQRVRQHVGEQPAHDDLTLIVLKRR